MWIATPLRNPTRIGCQKIGYEAEPQQRGQNAKDSSEKCQHHRERHQGIGMDRD